MPEHDAEKPLSETRRKEIFLALVEAQDHEITVPESRKMVAARFGVTESQVRQIEREGLERQWPPLSNGRSAETRPARQRLTDRGARVSISPETRNLTTWQ